MDNKVRQTGSVLISTDCRLSVAFYIVCPSKSPSACRYEVRQTSSVLISTDCRLSVAVSIRISTDDCLSVEISLSLQDKVRQTSSVLISTVCRLSVAFYIVCPSKFPSACRTKSDRRVRYDDDGLPPVRRCFDNEFRRSSSRQVGKVTYRSKTSKLKSEPAYQK
jgi:hypothetical protein